MNISQPLVSIVVPVYNVEKYHRKCLESIVNQTYKNLEIILVNDGSTDGSVAIMQEFADKDSRIKILHKENGGQASARNLGMTAVTGEWVWNIDSDDYVELDSVERMVVTAIENNSDVVVVGYSWATDDLKITHIVWPRFEGTISGEEALVLMLNHKIGGDVVGKFIKRSLYSDNNISIDERFSVIDDVLLCYRLYSVAKRVTAGQYYCLNHISHEGSTSSYAKTNRFLRLHHLGSVSMKEHGFISPAVEKAYNGFVFKDFLHVFFHKNAELLHELNLCSINDLYKKLNSLKKSDLVLSGGGLPYYFNLLNKTIITRYIAACLLRIKSLRYAKSDKQNSCKGEGK